MHIRNMKESDFIACFEIAKRAGPEYERAAVYHLFSKFFQRTCFVCQESNGAIRGFLLAFISPINKSDSYIHWIVVDPPFKRQGIASRLYERFFKAARRLGARRVRLTVAPTNSESLAFHRHLGFKPDVSNGASKAGGVVKDYNGPERHMCPLSRPL